MKDRSALERRLGELREELGRVEGGPTEVYSRIVGYYRSVRNWNAGKREEYAARRMFALPQSLPAGKAPLPSRVRPQPQAGETGGAVLGETGSVGPVEERGAAGPGELTAGLFVFTRAACPKCPPVTSFVRASGMKAQFVDVDREEGLRLARECGVMATPTVLELDARGVELFRAGDLAGLKTALEARVATC